MVDLMRFRNQFDDAYRKIYGEVPTEGEEGFKQMTASFLMSWLLYKEAHKDAAQEEREACAKVCDEFPFFTAEQCATAIRMRCET